MLDKIPALIFYAFLQSCLYNDIFHPSLLVTPLLGKDRLSCAIHPLYLKPVFLNLSLQIHDLPWGLFIESPSWVWALSNLINSRPICPELGKSRIFYQTSLYNKIYREVFFNAQESSYKDLSISFSWHLSSPNLGRPSDHVWYEVSRGRAELARWEWDRNLGCPG